MLRDRERGLDENESAAAGDARSRLRARYGVSDHHRIVLYTGTFEPYQGIDLLMDAAGAVVRARQDVRFLCLGGKERQIDEAKARAVKRGAGDRVIFAGTVPPGDVDPHFDIAAVLVSPRITGTNTPLKIYSYLRSGVPIVATRVLSHTQVLTDDLAVLVEPRPEALAAGIFRVLADEQLSRRLGENARRRAMESYSRETYVSKVAAVVSFLTNSARPRRSLASSGSA